MQKRKGRHYMTGTSGEMEVSNEKQSTGCTVYAEKPTPCPICVNCKMTLKEIENEKS